MFRNTVIILLSVLFFGGCKNEKKSDIPENAINPSVIENPVSASGKNARDNVPVLKFESDKHDFGTITEGEKVSFAFNFKNIGKTDLVIRAAQGSCGCTVPEFPKEAIKPADGGVINVTFNSEGKEGEQMKSIDIISNTMPNVYKLYVSCTVIKPKK